MWRREYSDRRMLKESYELILCKQIEYGVDLVNNADFEIWAGSHNNNDWYVDSDEE